MSTHRRSRAEWRAIVQRQARSGLSVTRFAARERLSARSLFWWRWRLRSDGETPVAAPADGTASTDKLELIPVELARVDPLPVGTSTVPSKVLRSTSNAEGGGAISGLGVKTQQSGYFRKFFGLSFLGVIQVNACI
ncbi:MAG: hypothetical protein IPN34_21280 [Planctomycetes bacterium]|nr:hypothetical protein [Planctomycetota bacterium]